MSKHLTPPADQWKEQLISGFSPNKGQTYYPGIAPGLYIFVQDLKTKKIFLMANPEGRGHPLLTNLINESQSLTKGDFRIGLAGEMLIGAEGEILGYAFQTGYFHQQLGLTEPDAGHPSYLDYMARLATILETALLPPSRHFNVKAWGEIFNKKNRESLFTSNGSFQEISREQLRSMQSQLQHYHTVKVNNLFSGLLNAVADRYAPAPNKGLSRVTACPATLFQNAILAEKRDEHEIKDRARLFSNQTSSHCMPSTVPASITKNHEQMLEEKFESSSRKLSQ